ncbi:MAG: dockerin type I domain-containing protein [Phycisphaerales bacterium JB052]
MDIMNSYRLALIAVCAGSTLAQTTYSEGTINIQRTKLQNYASGTDGWLSTQTTPRFWTWELSSSITDFSRTSPYMNQWIHVPPHVTSGLVDGSGTIDTTVLTDIATYISDRIIANGYTGGDYAIFIQNWIRESKLSQSSGDDLVLPLDSNGDPFDTAPGDPMENGWDDQDYGRNTGNTGTPWRSEGLADTYGDNLAASLINQIEINVLADPAYTTFPKPARVFFDEEFAPGAACGLEPIAMMQSMANDARFDTETLYGNFHLWDSTPSSTTADELFYDADLTNMPAWIPTYFDQYTIQTAWDLTSCNCNMSNPYCCPQPCWDHEYFPILHRVGGMLKSSRDGLIQAGFGDAIDSMWGSDVLWSNYGTSVWYSETYPSISRGDRGARDCSDRADQRYGSNQGASSGSADMHAPVLYPPYQEHQFDTLSDTDSCPATAPETHGEAWLRTARMQLDHAIFSFDEFDTLESGLSPKRFSPWVLQVGTVVYVPNSGRNYTITTKDNVRDIIALCKSRGANELIFWANPDTSGFQNGKQTDWDATNDALSQVYDYNLTSVVVNPDVSKSPSRTALDAMMFGEEHAHDVDAQTTYFGANTFVHASTQAEFTITNVATNATDYAFITEIIDGNGPWDAATFTVSIYNHSTSSYETLSVTHSEPMSTSTRRAVFDDTDMDHYSDWYTRDHDNQGDVSDVIDRKTIHRWDFKLSTPSDYISSGKMNIQLVATRIASGELTEADPLRIDLQQLYETDAANDNYASMTLATDLDGDGTTTAADAQCFIEHFVRNDHRGLDINGDGAVDLHDMECIINEMNSN